MNIDVKVQAGARKNYLAQEGGLIKVYLTAPPQQGKANRALIEFLADHFHVSKSQIEIIKGLKSRNKTITIWGIS